MASAIFCADLFGYIFDIIPMALSVSALTIAASSRSAVSRLAGSSRR
jgi:hypothetical protein